MRLGLARAAATGGALLATLLPAAAQTAPPLTLVESVPVETTLDNPDLPEAWEVWVDMIRGAQRRIDLAHFYASDNPGSRLEPVVEALEAAAGRGIPVRFLSEASFYVTYPETQDRLAAVDGIEVRRLAGREVMGGALHLKMMLVDDQVFIGSQNFDWRALEHIQELGLRIRIPQVVTAFDQVFRMDWAVAGGEMFSPTAGTDRARRVDLTWPDEALKIIPVASPQNHLPPAVEWDLPHLTRLIDDAQSTVRVQLLSYNAVGYDGDYFPDLENALRGAAARGVPIQLLLADWSKRASSIDGLKSLQCIPGIEVRLVTIPEWSGGFIPYARVIHAKYLVVDGEDFWLGTSNWSRSYFTQSRNVGVVAEYGPVARQLDAFFLRTWDSPYATTVDPAAVYTPPRRSR